MKVRFIIVVLCLILTGCVADVQVSWDIPIKRENFQFLDISEIDYFHIIYWKNTSDIKHFKTDGVMDTHIFKSLPQGRWKFRVTTVTTDGGESKFSDETGIIIDLNGNKKKLSSNA